MNVMILAAGLGERMRPLTRDVPKPLLEVGGRALIEHQLVALAGAGFERAVINVHYLAEQMTSRLGDGSRFGIEIAYSREEKLLGTAGGIRHALPLLGDAPFVVTNADIYTDYDFRRLIDSPRDARAHLVMVENPAWHPRGDFGIGEGGKLNAGPPCFTYGCISAYHPDFFAGGDFGPQPLRRLWDAAIERGEVTGEYYEGVWWNIGSPEQLADLKSMVE